MKTIIKRIPFPWVKLSLGNQLPAKPQLLKAGLRVKLRLNSFNIAKKIGNTDKEFT